MRAPHEIKVGTYYMGAEGVRLVLMRDETGGSFTACPEDGGVGLVRVGAQYEAWHQVVNVLLHEILEFVMYRMELRWRASQDISHDNGAYLFVMTHTQFSEAVSRAADYMAAALPPLGKAWKRMGGK